MTIVVTDETSADELAEALGHLVHAAKREMPVVGNPDHPTPWDAAHGRIDVLLDELDGKA